MNRLSIDVHILQTVPPSNLNRDDTGSPKTAVYGGTRRARVSSQAWKRATRLAFADRVDTQDLGWRTKRVVELLAETITRQDETLRERSTDIAATMMRAAGIALTMPRKKAEVVGAAPESGYLLFLGRRQLEQLAEAGIAAEREGRLATVEKDRETRHDAQRILKGSNPVDVALFGRMVADVTDLNVDAAVQVAHAISVHEVETEFDYFTAVDDHKKADVEEDAGAGMIGSVEFNSSTLYRFATVSVPQLRNNLGDDAATKVAVEAFLEAFVTSMPTGKITTFGNRTLPDVVLVAARTDQPVSYVGAFEEAVPPGLPGGRSTEAARHLATYANDITAAYGSAPDRSWVVGVGAKGTALTGIATPVTFPELVQQVGSYVDEALVGSA